MPGFYFGIHHHVLARDRAVPYVMIPFSMPYKGAPIGKEDVADFLFIFGHYRTILSCRSDVKTRENGIRPPWFISKSSGTANLTRSISASNDPDSSTSPGMSLLVAIHTDASLSHVKVTEYSIMYLR
jgi:hypothetical protein